MKQTILHISNNHSSFDDRIFYKELVSLSKYFDCHLIAGGNADGMLTTMGKDLLPAGIYNNVNILPYPVKKNLITRALRKLIPGIFNIICYHKLKKVCIINKIKPSILHYHDLDFTKIAKKIQKYFNCKLIFDCHEFYFSYFFEKKFNYSKLKKSAKSLLLFKKAVRTNDATITVTKNLDNIISLLNKNRKHIVVYNSSILPINNNIINNINKIILVHEGSMKFNRGLRLMMELFSDNYFRENVKLKIIGGIFGDENIYYKQKINEYCIDETMIELTGYINYEDIHKHLTGNIGIIFFEKTFNAYYSMPNKLFNYINAGLPILSTKCAELSDFISDNKIGYNVERNIDFIKEGINEIMTNYDFYKKNITEAQKLYTWENDQNKLLSLYDELLK